MHPTQNHNFQVIGLNTPLSQQAGYYCSVCDCVLRDSQSYLDHINGEGRARRRPARLNALPMYTAYVHCTALHLLAVCTCPCVA